MSKKDWQQLQAYRATGMTPQEAYRAIRDLAGTIYRDICYSAQDRNGCPGWEHCPMGASLRKRREADLKKAGYRIDADKLDCSYLATRYPAAVLRYFWAEAEKRTPKEADR